MSLWGVLISAVSEKYIIKTAVTIEGNSYISIFEVGILITADTSGNSYIGSFTHGKCYIGSFDTVVILKLTMT